VIPRARDFAAAVTACDAGAMGSSGWPAPAALLAHQGGWDEILFVLVPIALFAGLLALANKRASRELADRGSDVGVGVGADRDDEAPPAAG
jgi:hypothetical protein